MSQADHFCESVANLLSAQLVLLMEWPDVRPELPSLPIWTVCTGWPDASGPQIWQRSIVECEEPHPTMERLVRFDSSMVVRSRSELVESAEWERSTFVNDYMHAVGVDDHIILQKAMPVGGGLLGCGVHRVLRDRPFTTRERHVLELIGGEFGWFFSRLSDSLRTMPAKPLPTRYRYTFDGLLRGLSEGQIAYRTGLSRHTIHEYVKALYKQFNVSSRGELLALFVDRERADCRRFAHRVQGGGNGPD